MRSLILVLIALVLYPASLSAQTIVSGPVTGVWTAGNNPYIVANHIDAGGIYVVDSLIINEGVVVQFGAGLSLTVGTGDKFVARGTSVNPITFEAHLVHQPGAWNAISIVSSSDNDTLEYCNIRNANIGLYSYNSVILVNHCDIYENADYGLFVEHYVQSVDSSRISNCRVYENEGVAGICFYVSISTYYQTAISSIDIINSRIFNNSGNGVLIGSSRGIYNGTVSARGRITNCTIANNDSTGVVAYALSSYPYSGNSDATLTNCIVASSKGYGVANVGDGYISPIDINYSCFWGNQLGDFINIAGSGFGTNGPYQNANDDSCDVYFNIYNDPLFASQGDTSHDLTWLNYPADDSTRSHCIDAGTPVILGQYVLDPDGTLPDIGASIFYQPAVAVEEAGGTSFPNSFALQQNYPNPFNPVTVIEFDLPRHSTVNICVYNLLGQEVSRLVDNEYPAGNYRITWDGCTNSGVRAPSGVYFYRIEADGYAESRKMLLLK